MAIYQVPGSVNNLCYYECCGCPSGYFSSDYILCHECCEYCLPSALVASFGGCNHGSPGCSGTCNMCCNTDVPLLIQPGTCTHTGCCGDHQIQLNCTPSGLDDYLWQLYVLTNNGLCGGVGVQEIYRGYINANNCDCWPDPFNIPSMTIPYFGGLSDCTGCVITVSSVTEPA